MNMVKEKDHKSELNLIDRILQKRLYLRFIKLVLICYLKKRDSRPNALKHT